jgi:hypothetical protein
VFILTRICAEKKIFCRPTDPNFLAYVTGNIELFLGPTRIMKLHRASTTRERKGHLVQLAFEKQITKQLNLEEFLTIFGRKTRRLQL